MSNVCTLPPEGWNCSRTAGHDGPCAATPTRMTGGAQDSGAGYGTCRKCGFDLALAPGIDTYCPNKACGDPMAEMKAFIREHAEERDRAEYERLKAKFDTRATPAPAGWQPRIGEEVRVSEETAERWPDWRDTRLWVVGVSMDRNVSGTPTEGLNVCVSDEWPVTNRTGGFTDGFYINRPYAGDDLRPISTAPAEGGV